MRLWRKRDARELLSELGGWPGPATGRRGAVLLRAGAGSTGRGARGGCRVRAALDGPPGGAEGFFQSAAEERDSDDDHDGDEGDHDAVFDGGGAALIAAKAGCEVGEKGTHWDS